MIWNPRAFLDEIDPLHVARAPGRGGSPTGRASKNARFEKDVSVADLRRPASTASKPCKERDKIEQQRREEK
jgi:hypothetical protein